MICFLPKELLWPSLNIQKLKKEFWNRFKDHYDELKEIKEENNTYLFIGNNQNSIENQLKHIEHKLNNKKYKKYIDDSNKDINKIKFKKNIDFPRHPKINIKLENINFFNDFQKLIKLEFPTGHIGKSMKDYLYDDLAKKYSININEEDKENNYFFSLKTNFSYIWFIENLDHNRLHRIYYFKFKKKYKNIREDQLEKMKLKILYKNKNFLILEDMNVIVENRTNEIIKLINTDIKYNFDSDLVYQANSQLEIEQILVKTKKENLDAYNPPFFNHWVNAKRKKVKKIKNKELKKIDNFEQFSRHNSMHKLIIRTNKEGKINQSFKNKIYKLVTFDDIVNFEEAIYLSRKNIWSTPTEKHSFQFLIKDFSKYEKEINDLINQHKNSHNNAYKFLNKKDNDIEFEIIPIVNTLEHSDCSMECCSMNCCLMHDSSSQNLKY